MTLTVKPVVGAVLGAALLLTGCTDAGNDATQVVTETVTASDAHATGNSETTAPTTATAASATPGRDDDDPVFAAIEAALAAYQGAIVVDIDRDDGDAYDIDVVMGDDQVELEVTADGTVREDEREGDDDDVREARAATVSASDAIRQALEQHPEGALDELELDEEDGVLRWEVDLDDSQRSELVELEIPAA